MYYIKQSHRSVYQFSLRVCTRSRPRYLDEGLSRPKRCGRSLVGEGNWATSVVACGAGVLTSLDMDGWCKPVSSVVVFPRMFLNCASEAGPEKLLPATIQRKVEGDATGVAHPDDGHEGASAHAVVDVALRELCFKKLYGTQIPCGQVPRRNTWAGNAGSPCPHAALCASQTSTLVLVGRPWMVALSEVVSSAKRVPRIWNT
ncbi:hypothetical protein B0H13DRAFT_2152745 [Mycena leptocephala]|nr:hypothetical protein B0H13DRAFT_2152745 [Mycena leptocephala]